MAPKHRIKSGDQEHTAEAVAPLLPIPRRISVIVETEEAIRQAISDGSLAHTLPSERDLCEQLAVSRSTLRVVLKNLDEAGWIKIEHGRRTLITHQTADPSVGPRQQKMRNVVLLSPVPHFPLDSGAAWIDELRRLLYLLGYTLVIEYTLQNRDIDAKLSELTARYQSALWILQSCSEQVYTWFFKMKLPAIVSGVPHQGVELPSICVDLYAACRHAVGHLLALGHHRIGLIAPKAMLPGDEQSLYGFQDGLRAHRDKNVQHVILYYQTDAASIFKILNRELAKPDHATAFVVCRPSAVMGVISALAAMELSVPKNISIICRDYSPSAFAAIWPPLCHYYCNPAKIARKFVSALLKLESGVPLQRPNSYIVPAYTPGASVRSLGPS